MANQRKQSEGIEKALGYATFKVTIDNQIRKTFNKTAFYTLS